MHSFRAAIQINKTNYVSRLHRLPLFLSLSLSTFNPSRCWTQYLSFAFPVRERLCQQGAGWEVQVSVLGKGECPGNPWQTCMPKNRQTKSGAKDGGVWWRVAWMAGRDGWKYVWWCRRKRRRQGQSRRLCSCYPKHKQSPLLDCTLVKSLSCIGPHWPTMHKWNWPVRMSLLEYIHQPTYCTLDHSYPANYPACS